MLVWSSSEDSFILQILIEHLLVLGVGEWGVGKDTRVERTQPLHWAGQRVWHTVGTEILFLHQSLASASREPGTLLQTAEQTKGRAW